MSRQVETSFSSSSSATQAQKTAAHNLIDIILLSARMFGSSADSNYLKSNIYRLWGAVLDEKTMVEGLLDAYQGEHHFSQISSENAARFNCFFAAIRSINKNVLTHFSLINDWANKLDAKIEETDEKIENLRSKANSQKYSEQDFKEIRDKEIRDWVNEDALVQSIRAYNPLLTKEAKKEKAQLETTSSSSSSSSSSSAELSSIYSSTDEGSKIKTADDYLNDALLADKEEAIKIYEKWLEDNKTSSDKAAKSNILLNLGLYYVNDKREKEAFALFEEAHNLGNLYATNIMGCAYNEGRYGVEVNYLTAFQMFNIAAQGNTQVAAMYNLGACHLAGLGTEVNYKEAVSWFRKSADLGFASAQYLMASHYSKKGDKNDKNKELEWLKLAAAQKFPEAMFDLSLKYKYGETVKKDEKKYLKLLTDAAAAGYTEAKFILSKHYFCQYQQTGNEKDAIDAIRLMTEEADKGYIPAIYALGHHYSEGIGVEKNLQTAFDKISSAYKLAQLEEEQDSELIAVIRENAPKQLENIKSQIESITAANKKTFSALSRLIKLPNSDKFKAAIETKLSAFKDETGLNDEEKAELKRMKESYKIAEKTGTVSTSSSKSSSSGANASSSSTPTPTASVTNVSVAAQNNNQSQTKL